MRCNPVAAKGKSLFGSRTEPNKTDDKAERERIGKNGIVKEHYRRKQTGNLLKWGLGLVSSAWLRCLVTVGPMFAKPRGAPSHKPISKLAALARDLSRPDPVAFESLVKDAFPREWELWDSSKASDILNRHIMGVGVRVKASF